MTIPDVGGKTGAGRPPDPMPHEIEQTAAMQVLRWDVGIMPNTLEVMFYDLGGNVWKYLSHSSKPALPLYIGKIITNPENEPMTSPLERNAYTKLFNGLSLKVKERMRQQKGLAREDQDPLCLVLEKVLHFASRALVWLNEVSKINAESYAEVNREHLLLSEHAFDTGLELILDIINQLKRLKIELSADLGFGELIRVNVELLEKIFKMGQEIKRHEGGAHDGTLRDFLKYLLSIKAQFDRKQAEGILVIVSHLVEALIDKTAGMLLKIAVLYPFVLGSQALNASSAKNHAILGSNMVRCLERAVQTDDDPSLIYLTTISKLIPTLTTVLMVEAAQVTGSGFGLGVFAVSDDLKAYTDFALMLGETLIVYSGFITHLTGEIYRGTNLKGKDLLLSEEILKAMALNILPLAKTGILPLQGVKEGIKCQLDKLIEYFEEKDLKEVLVFLKQADLALKNRDALTYAFALHEMAKLDEIRGKDLQIECEGLLQDAISFLQGIHRAMSQRSATNVISQGV